MGSVDRNMEDLSIWSADDLVGGQVATEDPLRNRNHQNSIASTTASQASFDSLKKGSGTRVETTETTYDSITTLNHYSRLNGRVEPEFIVSGDIPPELLLDGARAVGAFCRPYPVATKGIIKSFSFEIRTSGFDLQVALDDRWRIDEPTVIYVPYVHYAADGKTMSVDAAGLRERSGPVQRLVKKEAREAQEFSEVLDTGDGGDSDGLQLDVDVEISEGRYEIQGQYLSWYYDAPEEKGREKNVKISIRRNGGPIKARVEQSIPSWGDLCPAGCAVM